MGLEEDFLMILTEIPVFTPEDNVTGCCPKFHPGHWEEKLFDFSAYAFIKGHSASLFYMPLNLDKVMTKIMTDIQNAKANFEDKMLVLSQDLSPFKAEHLFLVNGEVKGYKRQRLEGLFFCKVYDGPFKNMTEWMKDFDEVLRLKGRKLEEVYAYYTTCPKCAKVYEHNYVVLLAKVDAKFEL